MELKDSST